MGFEMRLNMPDGTKKLAKVSFFICKETDIREIISVKADCTEEALAEAKEELDNFLLLVRNAQQSGRGEQIMLQLDKMNTIPMSAVNVDNIICTTMGPRGAVAIGFDKEMRSSEEQLEQRAREAFANKGVPDKNKQEASSSVNSTTAPQPAQAPTGLSGTSSAADRPRKWWKFWE